MGHCNSMNHFTEISRNYGNAIQKSANICFNFLFFVENGRKTKQTNQKACVVYCWIPALVQFTYFFSRKNILITISFFTLGYPNLTNANKVYEKRSTWPYASVHRDLRLYSLNRLCNARQSSFIKWQQTMKREINIYTFFLVFLVHRVYQTTFVWGGNLTECF